MKNAITLTFIALFISQLSYGQKFKIEKSASFTKNHKNEISEIVFPSAYGFMTYSYTDVSFTNYAKSITLTSYDQTMQDAGTTHIDLPKVGYKVAVLDNVVETKNKLIIFSTFLSKKLGVHKAYVQSYDRESKAVSETAVAAEFPIEKLSKSGFYKIEASADNSKIAVFANLPFEKKTNESVRIWMYDQDMNLLWEQTETLDYPSKRAYTEEVFVTNNGEVLLFKTSDPFKKSRKTDILKFDGQQVSTSTFSEDGFHPRDIQMIDLQTKQLLTGFYWSGSRPAINTKDKLGEQTDGVFLFDISQNKILGKHSFKTNISEANIPDLVSLKIIDIEPLGDDIYIVAEKQLKDSSFKGEGTSKISTELEYTYTYGSKLLVNMDMQGTLKDMTRIQAKAVYKDETSIKGSLAAHYIDGGLRLFRNRRTGIVDKYFQLETFYSEENASSSNIYSRYILPHTVKVVPDYNIIYFMTQTGESIKFNKMTWE